MAESTKQMEQAYSLARERYAAIGVNVTAAISTLSRVPISLHCWQGDDVGGFEKSGEELGGGLAVTGNYLGKARTPDELRADLDLALSVIPGTHRLNLHACYAELGGQRVERNDLQPAHFQRWIDWAKAKRMGMDFNPTYFAHPKAADGFTLTHADDGHPPVLGRTRHRLPQDRRRDGPGAGHAVRHQRLDPGRHEGRDGRSQGPPRTPETIAGRNVRRVRSIRRTTWTRSKPSCSASARRPTSPARTSSIWATPSATRNCSAWTPATSIPRKPSPTRSPRCSCT